jgi:hypothetical protein
MAAAKGEGYDLGMARKNVVFFATWGIVLKAVDDWLKTSLANHFIAFPSWLKSGLKLLGLTDNHVAHAFGLNHGVDSDSPIGSPLPVVDDVFDKAKRFGGTGNVPFVVEASPIPNAITRVFEDPAKMGKRYEQSRLRRNLGEPNRDIVEAEEEALRKKEANAGKRQQKKWNSVHGFGIN